MNPAFDAIRRYIRYGDGDDNFVELANKPVLEHHSDDHPETRGHIVTVDWPSNCNEVRSSLGLFNQAFYEVRLSRNCTVVWRNVRSGRCFDHRSGKITKLIGGDRRFLP